MNTPNNPNESSQIGTGTIIKGKIITKEDIRVDGQVDGTLETNGRLIVGNKGNVTGVLKTKETIVSGKLDVGQLETDKITFKSTSHFKGEIHYKQMTVEPGAVIEGSLNTRK